MNPTPVAVAFASILALHPATAQVPFASPLERVSFTTARTNVDQPITLARVSDDGNRILFVTAAQNVGVGTPSPNRKDIYLRDTRIGQVAVIGIGVGNNIGLADAAHMTGDSRFVLFTGAAANRAAALGPDQVWLRDTFTGNLELITRTSAGGLANSTLVAASGISADGRYVLFLSDAADLAGGSSLGLVLYRLDRQTGALENVIVDRFGAPHGAGFGAATLSLSGRFVAFASERDDLVVGDTNGRFDHFLRDMVTGVIERLSVGTGGFESNGNSQRPAAISADGRFAVFCTSGRNLAPEVPQPAGAFYVVRDRQLNTTRAVAISPFGVPANCGATPIMETPRFLDRTHVAVYSTTVQLLDSSSSSPGRSQVYLTDVDTGATIMLSSTRGSAGNADSLTPSIAMNGLHVVFLSTATNLDPQAPPPTGVNNEVFRISFDCFASAQRVGRGTIGSGGITPLLFGVDATCDQSVALLAGGALGGSPLFLLLGAPALPPQTVAGALLHVDLQRTFSLVPVPNGGLSGIPGTGSWFGQIPVASFNNTTFALQVLGLDPAAPGGVSATNGLQLQVN